jgi:hypothetical protein
LFRLGGDKQITCRAKLCARFRHYWIYPFLASKNQRFQIQKILPQAPRQPPVFPYEKTAVKDGHRNFLEKGARGKDLLFKRGE